MTEPWRTSPNGREWTKDEWYRHERERLDGFPLFDEDDPDIGPVYLRDVELAHHLLNEMYLLDLTPLVWPSVDRGITITSSMQDHVRWVVDTYDVDSDEESLYVFAYRTDVGRLTKPFQYSTQSTREAVEFLAQSIKELS